MFLRKVVVSFVLAKGLLFVPVRANIQDNHAQLFEHAQEIKDFQQSFDIQTIVENLPEDEIRDILKKIMEIRKADNHLVPEIFIYAPPLYLFLIASFGLGYLTAMVFDHLEDSFDADFDDPSYLV